MAWRIAVESTEGKCETVGEWSVDLGEITVAALSLADELGRLLIDQPVDSIVHIISDAGKTELSIKVLRGGLDPNGDEKGSRPRSPTIFQ